MYRCADFKLERNLKIKEIQQQGLVAKIEN